MDLNLILDLIQLTHTNDYPSVQAINVECVCRYCYFVKQVLVWGFVTVRAASFAIKNKPKQHFK